MIITFVGDVHGWFNEFLATCKLYKDSDYIIQVGDTGFGFKNTLQYSNITLPKNVKFIRGNHDNPTLSRNHPNYLGDYGFNKDIGIFYISGAYSIDKAWRIPGVSWWEEEELNYNDLQKVAELWASVKPDIVVTHDCPKSVQSFLKSHHSDGNRTNNALEFLFNEHKPKFWVFGHHHIYKREKVLGTTFQCLPELGTVTIDTNNL
jgi:Icc-related predicted phosphoesterase